MTATVIFAVVIVALTLGAARADDDGTAVQFAASRAVTAPLAGLPPAGGGAVTATSDLRASVGGRVEASVVASYGLGGLAEVELGVDSEARACGRCEVERAAPIHLGRAAFRLGARRGRLALVGGLRTAFAATGPVSGARTAEAYAIGGVVLGPIRLHVGALALDAVVDGHRARGAAMRPVGAFEWMPAQYPRTALLADLTWAARFEPSGAELEWLAGWGVRYRAFAWGAIDLAVRHREGDALGDATVLVRVTASRR